MNQFLLYLGRLLCKIDNYLILGLAAANIVLYVFIRIWNRRIRDRLHPEGSIVYKKKTDIELEKNQMIELSKKRNLLVILYSLYANFTGIFALLGILGTVASLMTNTQETMMENFMVALDTTLLGVIFGIIFKAMDGSISAQMELNLDEVETVLSDFGKELEDAE